MPPKKQTPDIKQRVKVSILPSTDAQEPVELDYRVFITGDFTHSEPGQHKDGDGSLKERRMRTIKNKRDFKTVMEDLNPRLKLNVPNRLSDDPEAYMDVDLDIKTMKDFHPDVIAEKVPALKELIEARQRLKQLKVQILKDVKLKKAIEGVLKEGSGSVEDLLNKLAPAKAAEG